VFQNAFIHPKNHITPLITKQYSN